MMRTSVVVSIVAALVAASSRDVRADSVQGASCAIAAPLAGGGGYLLYRDGLSRKQNWFVGGLEAGLGGALVLGGFGLAGCAVEGLVAPNLESRRWAARGAAFGIIAAAPLAGWAGYESVPGSRTEDEHWDAAKAFAGTTVAIGASLIVMSFFIKEDTTDDAWTLVPTIGRDMSGLALTGSF